MTSTGSSVMSGSPHWRDLGSGQLLVVLTNDAILVPEGRKGWRGGGPIMRLPFSLVAVHNEVDIRSTSLMTGRQSSNSQVSGDIQGPGTFI